MDRILDKKPVNTSRQSEFDYLKGFFMVFIFLIHAYQATLSNEDIVIRIVYGFATLSGAAIFIFVMGMGTVYSRNSEPRQKFNRRRIKHELFGRISSYGA